MKFSELDKNTPKTQKKQRNGVILPENEEKTAEQPAVESRKTIPPETKEPAKPLQNSDPRQGKTQSGISGQFVEAQKIYGKTISFVKNLISNINEGTPPIRADMECCRDILKLHKDLNKQILTCAAMSTAGNYLYAHSANTAIIAMCMANHMEMDDNSQIFAGYCGLLHDIGMPAVMHIAKREKKLSAEEFIEIQTHSRLGGALVNNITGISPDTAGKIKTVISQVHERIDGNGYPDGLKDSRINVFAQIIGIADVYEALTHPRSWREAMHPHNAMKYIIGQKDILFNPALSRSLIACLSMYPPGSYVLLSTGETAKVISVNSSAIMRPIVEIIFDASGRPPNSQILDLSEYPITSISGIVEDTSLGLHDPKLRLQLEASRWWVEW